MKNHLETIITVMLWAMGALLLIPLFMRLLAAFLDMMDYKWS